MNVIVGGPRTGCPGGFHGGPGPPARRGCSSRGADPGGIAGSPRPGPVAGRPDSLTGDKAYGSKANRAAARRRDITMVVAEGRDQAFDAVRYKRRNQVERGFNRRKQFRAIATRYDKLKLHWQASNDIVETIDWIRATPDKARS